MSTPSSTPVPIKCHTNIVYTKAFINKIINTYIGLQDLTTTTGMYNKAFAEKVRKLSIQTLTINNKPVEYVLQKLSCQDYCTLNTDATYNSTTNVCTCNNPDYMVNDTPFTYINNNSVLTPVGTPLPTNAILTTINTNFCKLSPLVDFKNQLQKIDDNLTSLSSGFQTVSLNISCNNGVCPTYAPLVNENM